MRTFGRSGVSVEELMQLYLAAKRLGEPGAIRQWRLLYEQAASDAAGEQHRVAVADAGTAIGEGE